MGDLSWRFGKKEREYVEEVLSSGFASSTSGTMNTKLKEEFAKAHGKNFAITFNSGTTTLHASLWALGVNYGDEVLVPCLTVISCMRIFSVILTLTQKISIFPMETQKI